MTPDQGPRFGEAFRELVVAGTRRVNSVLKHAADVAKSADVTRIGKDFYEWRSFAQGVKKSRQVRGRSGQEMSKKE